MGTTMNKKAYEDLVAENLVWLLNQERTLERGHIESIIKYSVETYHLREELPAENAKLKVELGEQKFLFEQKTDQWKRLDETCHDLHDKWDKCQQENAGLTVAIQAKQKLCERIEEENAKLKAELAEERESHRKSTGFYGEGGY